MTAEISIARPVDIAGAAIFSFSFASAHARAALLKATKEAG